MTNARSDTKFALLGFQKDLLYRLKYSFVKSSYFNLKKRLEFYRVIRTFTQNGISIQASLKYYGQMLQKYSRDDGMNFIIQDILALMDTGTRFERAISRWIPEEEQAIIESSSKDVARACEVVTVFAENMMSIKSALVDALTYPIIMFVILIASLLGFSLYMIPMMEQLSPHSSWPVMAQNLYSLTSYVREHGTLLFGSFFALVVLSTYSMSRLTNPVIRGLLDYLPPWNIYKPYVSTSFLIALSSLIKTGSSFNNSVHKMSETASPYLMFFLKRIARRLSAGNNFGDSLVVGLFKGNLLISLAVFAITNRLEQGIQFLADENLGEQRLVFVKKGRILGYSLMILVAIVIGWVMLSLYGIQSSLQVSSIAV
jgi:type II secretory pathway component PulF